MLRRQRATGRPGDCGQVTEGALGREKQNIRSSAALHGDRGIVGIIVTSDHDRSTIQTTKVASPCRNHGGYSDPVDERRDWNP